MGVDRNIEDIVIYPISYYGGFTVVSCSLLVTQLILLRQTLSNPQL